MNNSIIEKYPIVHYMFNKVNNSKSLENILKDFDKLPDFSSIEYNSCDPSIFNFLKNINEKLFLSVDQEIIKMRENELYYSELKEDERKIILDNIILYINVVIKFIKLCCLFTNKKTKDELIRLILSRLKNSMPKCIKDAVKIYSIKRESNMKINKMKQLVKQANYYDMIGDYKSADKIDKYISKFAKEDQFPLKIPEGEGPMSLNRELFKREDMGSDAEYEQYLDYWLEPITLRPNSKYYLARAKRPGPYKISLTQEEVNIFKEKLIFKTIKSKEEFVYDQKIQRLEGVARMLVDRKSIGRTDEVSLTLNDPEVLAEYKKRENKINEQIEGLWTRYLDSNGVTEDQLDALDKTRQAKFVQNLNALNSQLDGINITDTTTQESETDQTETQETTSAITTPKSDEVIKLTGKCDIGWAEIFEVGVKAGGAENLKENFLYFKGRFMRLRGDKERLNGTRFHFKKGDGLRFTNTRKDYIRKGCLKDLTPLAQEGTYKTYQGMNRAVSPAKAADIHVKKELAKTMGIDSVHPEAILFKDLNLTDYTFVAEPALGNEIEIRSVKDISDANKGELVEGYTISGDFLLNDEGERVARKVGFKEK